METKHYNRDSYLGRWLNFFYEDYPESTCQLRLWFIGSLLLAPFALIPLLGRKFIPEAIRIPPARRAPSPSLVQFAWLGIAIIFLSVLISAIMADKEGYWWVYPFLLCLGFAYFMTWFFMIMEKINYIRDQKRKERPPEPDKGPSSWSMVMDSINDFKQKVCKPIEWV